MINVGCAGQYITGLLAWSHPFGKDLSHLNRVSILRFELELQHFLLKGKKEKKIYIYIYFDLDSVF